MWSTFIAADRVQMMEKKMIDLACVARKEAVDS